MKVKKIFFCASYRGIGPTHLRTAVFRSISPYSNRTTSNLMATALWYLKVIAPEWH